jgi:hypothetical protein
MATAYQLSLDLLSTQFSPFVEELRLSKYPITNSASRSLF